MKKLTYLPYALLIFTASFVHASELPRLPDSLDRNLPGEALPAQERLACEAANSTSSLARLECFADKGNVAAMISLGLEYGSSPEGLSKSLHWFHQAADAGSAYAMRQLGLIYVSPKNPEPDTKQGFHWLQKAANQGEVDAYIDLAKLYATGTGTPKNLEKAKIWADKAEKLNLELPPSLSTL